ncbi:MAG: zinc ribbon domain-containing protein [Erysipelotrichaceae bacterium]|nr:zinc ribbon domain-containing protein [Erysipelotrichaceae bacterium]
MVNCKNCGAPLSLEEAVCPHCGTPNPEAQEHLKKLAQLDKDYKKTKKEVFEEVHKSKKGYGVLVILVMMLLANLAMIPFHAASYDIAEKIIASRMSDTEIIDTIETLMNEGEYIEMALFMDKYQLPYSKYGSYFQLSYLAEYYNRVIENMTDYLYMEDRYSDPLMKVCENAKEFKDEYVRIKKREYYPEMAAHCDRLNDEFDLYLKEYLKLNDEDIASISDLSSSQLLVLASERMAGHEE